MYTIFSMLFVLLISPFSWIVALLFVAILSKKPKRKKRALLAAVIVLIVFSNPFLLHMFARNWDLEPGRLENGKVYSAAIILGGFTNEDKNGKGFYTDHSDRLIEGLRLKATGKVSHIMMSGGNSDLDADQFTESGWVKKTLKELNFPDSVILIEQKSGNTYENAVYTKEVLMKANLKPPYLLVTSAFHMRRAAYIFRKKGLDVIPYPCDYMAGNTNLWLMDYIVPSLNTLYYWNFYMKEIFGLAVAHIRG